MTDTRTPALNDEVRRIWDTNAAYWDARMADGNDFQRLLIGPATERLLNVSPGERIVEAACGNGVMARRLAELGAEVVAFDFSPEMIRHAQARSPQDPPIDFRVVDGVDLDAMLALGEQSFDGGVCNMAIMDMAEVDPLMQAMSRLIKPGGRFVFSVCHPCFNSTAALKLAEQEEKDGEIRTTYSIKVSAYIHSHVERGLAMIGQPEPQLYFERPISAILASLFAAGMVVDGFEEPAFEGASTGGNSIISWDRYPDIPPVMVVRARIA